MAEFEEKLNQILSSPEAMEQIMSLANSLSGGGAAEPSEQAAPSPPSPALPAPATGSGGMGGLGELLSGIDPGMISKLLSLVKQFQYQEDEKTRLLEAMKPFLAPDRQGKLDKAVQIARLSRVIRSAMTMFREGQDV